MEIVENKFDSDTSIVTIKANNIRNKRSPVKFGFRNTIIPEKGPIINAHKNKNC